MPLSFILDLPNLYGQSYPPAEQWVLYDEMGEVRITDTLEACQAAARPDFHGKTVATAETGPGGMPPR